MPSLIKLLSSDNCSISNCKTWLCLLSVFREAEPEDSIWKYLTPVESEKNAHSQQVSDGFNFRFFLVLFRIKCTTAMLPPCYGSKNSVNIKREPLCIRFNFRFPDSAEKYHSSCIVNLTHVKAATQERF